MISFSSLIAVPATVSIEKTGLLQIIGSNPALPTVAIISTGGTIAEKTDPKTGGAVPAVSGADLVAAIPGLDKLANIAVLDFCNIDSSQMSPEIWANLSRKADEILKKLFN